MVFDQFFHDPFGDPVRKKSILPGGARHLFPDITAGVCCVLHEEIYSGMYIDSDGGV